MKHIKHSHTPYILTTGASPNSHLVNVSCWYQRQENEEKRKYQVWLTASLSTRPNQFKRLRIFISRSAADAIRWWRILPPTGKRVDRQAARESKLEFNKSAIWIAFADNNGTGAVSSKPADLTRAAQQRMCLPHHSTKLLSCLLIVIIVEDYTIDGEHPAARSGLARWFLKFWLLLDAASYQRLLFFVGSIPPLQ